jgi:predicted lipid-binding transport protein (Tim44 family)
LNPLRVSAIARPAPRARRVDAWLGPLACFAAAMLIGSSLFSTFRYGLGGVDGGRFDLLLGGQVVFLLMFLRGRHAAPTPPIHDDTPSGGAMAGEHPSDDSPSGDSSFDRGVLEIRRTDPKFDPGRFAGYAGMVFRDAQNAWTTRDIGSLRDRVTPEMRGALQAQYDRLRNTHQVNRAAEIEITAEVTEAWQESNRDYVTAHMGGSIVDYTVDEASDSLVDGSRTIARTVDEFWTLTRPAGLNFWMLSAIQAT